MVQNNTYIHLLTAFGEPFTGCFLCVMTSGKGVRFLILMRASPSQEILHVGCSLRGYSFMDAKIIEPENLT